MILPAVSIAVQDLKAKHEAQEHSHKQKTNTKKHAFLSAPRKKGHRRQKHLAL